MGVDQDRGQGIVDLVGDAGGHLAERGQLFRHDELVLGLAQLPRALLDPPLQGPAPLGQVLVGQAELVGHAVERPGQLADLVPALELDPVAAGRPGRSCPSASTMTARGRVIRRATNDSRPEEEEDAQGGDAGERRHDPVAQVDVGPLEHADVEHADRPAGDVLDRPVGRDVPGRHDEGPPDVGLPPVEHGLLDLAGNARPHRPVALIVEDVGGDPEVVLEQGRRPDVVALVFLPFEDDLLDPVDEVVVPVEEQAARRGRRGGRPSRPRRARRP